MPSRILRLVITGDSRQAVRAIQDVETASERSARRVTEANRRQASGFNEVHGSASRLHERMAVMAGSVGLGGLAFGFADTMKAGMAWQQQLGGLSRTLTNTHTGGAKTLDMLSSAAEMASTKGGFTAPAELQALSQFTTLTHNANESLRLNALAMNLARGTGLGYTTTQRMLGQVMTGNVGRLQRYLGIIQPVKTNVQALTAAHKLNVFQLEAQAKAMGKAGPLWLKQQQLLHGITPLQLQHAQLMDKQATAQKALALIQGKYGGQMTTFSRSATGQMSNLRNSVEVLSASLGAALLPAFQSVIGVLTDAARWMQRHKTATMIAVGAVAALTVGTLAYSAAADVAKLATAAFAATSFLFTGLLDAIGFARVAFIMLGVNATAAWAAATLGLSLLIAGVVLAVTHFGTFKRIVGGVWKWFTGAVGTAADALKSVFEPPIKWLIHAIRWIVDKVLWLPRELAKLNPFGGGPADTAHGRASIAHHAHSLGLATGFGRPVPIPLPHGTVHSSSTPSSNGLNTINAGGHMTSSESRDLVTHVHVHVAGKVLAQESVRQSLRAVALG